MASRLTQIANKLRPSENKLKQTRQKYPVEAQELKNLIFKEKYAKLRQQTFDVISQNFHIFKHGDVEEMDRAQQRESGARMVLEFHKLRNQRLVKVSDYLKDPHALTITAHSTYNFDPGFSVKADVHTFLYFKTILTFHTSQLHKELLRKASVLEDIGCFGCTEMGHGSYMKGALTQATYDPTTKQFILNTPSDQGMKFWIGAAAQLANMSVIWAQLNIGNVNYGPHFFIAPLRDKLTHQVLDGVIVGDCGPKNSLNIIDNGFISFKNYRIPKAYMLDKIAGVDDNGKFVTKITDNQKRFGMYMNPLSFGRTFVALNTMAATSNSLNIAIKYAFTRRQFLPPNETQQVLLIDYPTTKYRLMPLLAQAVVYYFGGAYMIRTYDENFDRILKHDPKDKFLGELHAMSGVMKAQSSWFTTDVTSQCRQILGGHGYSSFSRLGKLHHDAELNTTWQGDNHMLLQQTTKYLLKLAQKITMGQQQQESSLNFLSQSIQLPENITGQNFGCMNFIQKVLKKRVIQAVNTMMGAMMKMKSQNNKTMDIWNRSQPYYGKHLCFCYGDLIYFQIINKAMEQASEKTKQLLKHCIKLWALNILVNQKWGTLQMRQMMKQEIVKMCDVLVNWSISLIEAIAAPSQIIGSVFADENGQGMKKYINNVYSAKDTFKRVDWYEDLVKARGV